MFEKRNFRDLYEAMATDARRRAPTLTDFQEGSVVRSLLESFAYEMAVLYEQMDLVYQAGYVDTAVGPNLDRVVAVLGITRNEPDFATGEVTFERDPGSDADLLIPVGTLVTTEEDEEKTPAKKAYLTTEEEWLRGGQTAVEVKVQAVERGAQLTAESETVVVMPRPLPGIKVIHNKKPIRFLGRERETDEELRERAKKALLASGRASPTAIENALLGMPGVRGVRVRETFTAEDDLPEGEAAPAVAAETKTARKSAKSAKAEPAADGNGNGNGTGRRTGRGVVEVFVDGLNAENANALRARIDEVRAAGVYVLLDPAVAINVQASLRIEAEGRIMGEDRVLLERQVRDVVYSFIDRLRMGQPLLFSQLTKEVLNVKGVTDLSDFRITTFREARSWAAGSVVLTRAADLGKTLSVPRGTVLTTSTGLVYELSEEARIAQGAASTPAPVRARRLGRDGELLRTGSAVAWEPITVDGVVLSTSNEAPLLLERQVWDPQSHKRIDAALEERFVPDLVRVAGEVKPLNVHVLISLAFPNAETRAALAAALQQQLDAATATVKLPADLGVEVDAAARTALTGVLTDYFRAARAAADTLRAYLTVVVDQGTRQAMAETARAYFAERRDAPGTIVVSELEQRLRATLDAQLASAPDAKLKTPLRDRTRAGVQAFLAEQLEAFPADRLADALRAAVDARAAASLATLEQSARTLADTLGTQRLALSGKALAMASVLQDDKATEAAKTAARTDYENAQKALAASEAEQRTIDADRQKATRDQEAARARVPAVVDSLRALVEGALQKLLADATLNAIVEGRAVAAAFQLGVRLRTVTFEGEIRADAPRIEPSLVERPEPAVVFIYGPVVPLTGTLTLQLPLTATDEERRLVKAQVRQAITDFVDGLSPEVDVELDRLRALADAHERVLRAAFEPSDALKAEKDRLAKNGTVLNVNAFEKVVLGDERGFEIRG